MCSSDLVADDCGETVEQRGLEVDIVVQHDAILEYDAIGLNRIILLSLCLSMIFSENRCPLFRIMP